MLRGPRIACHHAFAHRLIDKSPHLGVLKHGSRAILYLQAPDSVQSDSCREDPELGAYALNSTDNLENTSAT